MIHRNMHNSIKLANLHKIGFDLTNIHSYPLYLIDILELNNNMHHRVHS